MSQPMVSIIVPTFNSEGTIARCLRSIKDQTYPNVEIIVVDRYSRDNTLKIAKKFNVRILLMDSERSAARNRGVAIAQGLFLLFLDSDMELTSTVIEECIAACLQKGVGAAIIPEASIAKGFLAECRKIEKASYTGNKFFEAPRFFKKEAFDLVGGFDERLTFGEDSNLHTRLERAGYTTSRIQARIRHHEGELSIRKAVLKAHFYGKSLLPLIRRSPSLFLKKYYPPHMAYVRNAKLLLKDPIHFIGLIAIKLIEYIAYLTGVFVFLLGI